MDGKILSLFRKGTLLRQMYYGGYEDFDGANGGVWKKYINIPIKTVPLEYAQYLIEIDDTNVSVYNAKGDLKAQSSIASEFWSLVRSDGFDIRVFDHLFNQLWFWVGEFDYTNKIAKIWVRLPENSEELNIAFGNEKASESVYNNGDNVFEFFDDFDGTELDTNKWTVVSNNTGYYEIENSLLHIYLKEGGTETAITIKCNNVFPYSQISQYVFVARVKANGVSNPADSWVLSGMGVGRENSGGLGWDNKFIVGWEGYNDRYALHSWIGHMESISLDAVNDVWYIYLLYVESSSKAKGCIGDSCATATWDIGTTTNYELVIGGQGNAYVEYWFDWVGVLSSKDPATFDTPKILEF